jgi:hypothetical protein
MQESTFLVNRSLFQKRQKSTLLFNHPFSKKATLFNLLVQLSDNRKTRLFNLLIIKNALPGFEQSIFLSVCSTLSTNLLVFGSGRRGSLVATGEKCENLTKVLNNLLASLFQDPNGIPADVADG